MRGYTQSEAVVHVGQEAIARRAYYGVAPGSVGLVIGVDRLSSHKDWALVVRWPSGQVNWFQHQGATLVLALQPGRCDTADHHVAQYGRLADYAGCLLELPAEPGQPSSRGTGLRPTFSRGHDAWLLLVETADGVRLVSSEHLTAGRRRAPSAA